MKQNGPKTIHLADETWKQLWQLKLERGDKTFDQTVKMLMENQ